mmetsp:Transcript_9996/g.34833  ORF Transcript_9996/g.34833 Transcript_9996/m.34833 type:complete len:198 (-) Transcript_9996:2675-3268(-)
MFLKQIAILVLAYHRLFTLYLGWPAILYLKIVGIDLSYTRTSAQANFSKYLHEWPSGSHIVIKYSHIEQNVEIAGTVNIEGAYVNSDVIIHGGMGKFYDIPVSIGSCVSIAPRVILSVWSHPIHLDGAGAESHCDRITIEDHAWVCAGAIICPGVTIGRGAVVAAGAVVTKNVPPFTLVAGVPAVFKKSLESKRHSI